MHRIRQGTFEINVIVVAGKRDADGVVRRPHHEFCRRRLPAPQEGHPLAIEDVGAYGFAMASHYNLWPLPREYVVRDGQLADT